MDSYARFLEHFNISEDTFIKWGIESIIYPPENEVRSEWEKLKYRIFNNEKVYIRGYGRNGHATTLYINLYAELFQNYNVKVDPSNNTAPKKLLESITNNKNNKNYINYQRAHIFGKTKNIFLFEAPWNLCYIPKIFDPFSGHEASGHLPDLFQNLFLKNACDRFSDYILEYNEILNSLDIRNRLNDYCDSLKELYPTNELNQFAKDAHNELSPIVF